MTVAEHQNRLQEEVRQSFESKLTQQQARVHTTCSERSRTEMARNYAFTPPVYELTSGAYVKLLDKMEYVSQLYPGIKEWRLQFDAAGAGVTQVVISPITRNVTQDLSPMNVWRLALWKGGESAGLTEYMEKSDLEREISQFVSQFGKLVVLSDWQGLRLITGAKTPAHRNMTAQCCSFCRQSKGDMKLCLDPGDSSLTENDVFKEVLGSVFERAACTFHGLRIFISWLWVQCVDLVKQWRRGVVTAAIKALNDKYKIAWTEDKYLPFEVFRQFVNDRSYMLLLEGILDIDKKIKFNGHMISKADLMLDLWKQATVITENCFSKDPNIEDFCTACTTVAAIVRTFKFTATVWPHAVMFHFPHFIKHWGSLIVLDNRNLERAHPELVSFCNHSQHGQKSGRDGETGWMFALGKDNQKLQYRLQDLFKDCPVE